ncbi:type II secretion system protein GspL [Sandarakinorhabdus sp.]|jgi:general secretion pathway protein L|uniref:type II secretion system protein GspL n=1 Tax=Sandarakinorhabdus sp. TaxID=1916663 RepID=UPI0028AF9EC2|nr:type II secretion system protein GspL [Sandarakinorhabdus sp.]
MMPKSVLVTLVPRVRWQRSDGTGGSGWPAPDGSPLVLAVPGEAVALHWLDLPDLAPAQAAAAARMALADRLAEADPHIAVAPGSGLRPVAVVAREQMAGWLAEAARAGWKPTAIIPDPFLLPAPASGWAVAQDGPRVLARSTSAAFAAEADLAAAIIGTDTTTLAQPALPDVLPLDLLSGDYAPVTRWQPDRRQLKRLALIAAAIAGLWLGGDLAALLRARSAASAADAELLALAPGATDGTSAFAALQAQAQQRGAAGGLAALAGPVVQALSARPGAGLASLSYTPTGGLVAGVAGGGGEAQALADALGAASLSANTGTTRATADGSISEVTVRAR